MTTSFLEQVRARRAAMGVAAPTAEVAPAKITYDADLIPDLGPSTYKRTTEDTDIDSLLGSVGILQAYQLWCGKMEPEAAGKRESVMCSCPNPAHPDKVPSAWLNLDKDVYHCGGCNEGGDKYDIAAYHFGHDVPGYKTASFPDLRREMAQSLGYTVIKSAGGTSIVVKDEPEPDPPAAAPVLSIVPKMAPAPTVKIEWRELVPEGTFLHQWMSVCSTDDLPEEFYFWLGLMAVGLAAGDDVLLRDNPLVKANLFVTLFGPTGIGKTRAVRALNELLGKALPYDRNDPRSTGICKVPSPGSGEALIDAFSKPIFDPTDPKKVVDYAQVRGLLYLDELSHLTGMTGRAGSIMKPILMQLYDAYGDMEQRSRGTGFVRAKSPYCAAVTSTQPRAIRDLLRQTDADSGFINRWVFAMGSPKKLVSIDREPLDIDSCVGALQRIRAWSASLLTIALDDSGKSIWSDFFMNTIEPIKVRGEDSLLTRSDLTLKKIMLLFAINEGATVVDKGIVDRVLQLWPYLRDTYNSLGNEIGVGEFEDCRLRVIEFVRKWESDHGEGPTSRDLSRGMPKHYDRGLVLKTISNLEEMGEINPEVGARKGKGRPGGVRYRVAS